MIGLSDLEGSWRLSRQIDDRRAGVTGQFEGQARWVRDAAGMRQEETGLLRYGAAPPMQASRVYLWRVGPAGVEVFFEDGRPFHSFGLDRLQDTHQCAPDLYEVTYDFDDWPVWRQSWHITGPRKSVWLASEFRRA